MPWTNVFNLPAPIVDLVKGDFYATKSGEQLAAYVKKHNITGPWLHFSVTELIKPPRVRALYARYGGELVRDISTQVFSLLGTLFHNAFRDSAIAGVVTAGSGYVAEERLFTHWVSHGGRTVIISGEPDLVSPDGVIDDYKVTSVYAWEKGAKLEWEYQLNLYALLRKLNGKNTYGLRVVYIIRDWLMRQMVQEGYPQAPAQTEDLPLWSFELQEQYMQERVRLHMQAMDQNDDQLPECTEHEMWARPESWAVIREGGDRAAKLFKVEDFPEDTDPEIVKQAAWADQELRNNKLKKGQKPYAVEHRPGERVRCQSYCDVRGHCNSWKEFSSAAFGKAKAATP